tara:strand:- start:7477 stop:8601 length:1125 start_codon:yes stop_codon:yes gene_type:complete
MNELIMFVAFIIATLSIFLDFKKPKTVLFFLFCFVIFLEGTKWTIGVDWNSYYDYFYAVDEPFKSMQGGNLFEPGFVLYTYLISSVTENYSIYLSITMVIVYGCIFYSTSKITNNSFVAIFYLLTFIPWYSGALRQMIALAIFSLCIESIIFRKFFKFMFLVLFAFTFHITAIAYLPVYFFYGISWLSFIGLFFLAFILSINSRSILTLADSTLGSFTSRSYLNYLDNIGVVKTNPLLGFIRKFISLSGLYVFGMVSQKNMHPDQKNNIKYFLMISTFTIITYFVGIYFIRSIGSRLDLYISSIFFAMAIGLIDKNLKKKSNRFIFFIFVTSLSLVFYSRLGFDDLFYPYQSIFYNIDFERVFNTCPRFDPFCN